MLSLETAKDKKRMDIASIADMLLRGQLLRGFNMEKYVDKASQKLY